MVTASTASRRGRTQRPRWESVSGYAYIVTAGEDVRSARIAAGQSIRDLAKRADVAASTVWRIESGRLDPTVGMLERLLPAADGSETVPRRAREAEVSLALGRLTAAELLRDPPPVLERARRRVQATLANPDLPASRRADR